MVAMLDWRVLWLGTSTALFAASMPESPAPVEPLSSQELDALFHTVYDELKKSAHLVRRQRQAFGANSYGKSDDGMHTTQLVHELYLRLRKSSSLAFLSKPQFFSYAARAMRSIVLDQARSRQSAQQRDQAHLQLEAVASDPFAKSPELAIALDSALEALADQDARAAQVVELHFFLELPLAEIAEQLDINLRTVDRDWRFARAFLRTAVPDTIWLH
jgi:RNA polymerase sigma factor (TIGR02999 family)